MCMHMSPPTHTHTTTTTHTQSHNHTITHPITDNHTITHGLPPPPPVQSDAVNVLAHCQKREGEDAVIVRCGETDSVRHSRWA